MKWKWKSLILLVGAAFCAQLTKAEPVNCRGQYRQMQSVTIRDTAKDTLIEVGDTAPLFSLPDMKGRLMDWSVYKGKYVLLDFWASWCKPCRAQNPGLVRLYRKYSNADFEVVGVSIDTDRSAWYAAVKKDSLPWLNIADLNGKNMIVARYVNYLADGQLVRAVPQNYLLDPAGRVIGKNLHGEERDAALNKLLMLKTKP